MATVGRAPLFIYRRKTALRHRDLSVGLPVCIIDDVQGATHVPSMRRIKFRHVDFSVGTTPCQIAETQVVPPGTIFNALRPRLRLVKHIEQSIGTALCQISDEAQVVPPGATFVSSQRRPKRTHFDPSINNAICVIDDVQGSTFVPDGHQNRLHRQRIERSVSTPYSSIDQSLSPSLFTNTSFFYAPTVTLQEIPAGNQAVFNRYPRRRHIDQSVSTPTSTTLVANNLTPSLFTNTNVFYSPTVSPGAVDLSPSLYTNTNTFYVPTVTLQEIPTSNQIAFRRSIRRRYIDSSVSTPYSTINQSLVPSLYTNTNTFYGPVVTSTINLSPSLYTSTNTFYTPVVTEQEFPSNTQVIFNKRAPRRHFDPSTGTPNSTILIPNLITPSLYTNTNTFYSPTVSPGSIDLEPDLYVNVNQFYTPIISVPGQEVEIPRISSGVSGPPFRFIETINVTVHGIILTCRAILLPGKAITISLLPGMAKIDAIAKQSSSMYPVKLKFVSVGRAVTNEITDEEMKYLLAILSKDLR